MSGSQMLLLGGNPQQAAVDPYFYSVTSLLHGDGTNGGQNNTFLDSSTNNFTITRNGNTTQGSFSPFSQTGWAFYQNPLNDYLNFTTGAGTLFQFTGDYTIEVWVFLPSIGSDTSIWVSNDGSSNYHAFNIDATNYNIYLNSGSPTSSFSHGIALNAWTHVAMVRSGSTVTLYTNGLSRGTITNSSTNGYASPTLARNGGGASGSTARYLSNLRIVKGTAVYTANFTPSTTPLTAISGTSLLTSQANRFLDASSNALVPTVTGSPSVQPFPPFNPITPYSTSSIGGSGYFDGSGDYLTAPDNAAFDLGAGAFTLECFAYLNARAGAYDTLIAQWNNSSDSWLLFLSGNTIQFYGNGALAKSESVTITTGQWYHFACTRDSSNNLRLYANGVKLGSDTAYSTTLINSTASPSIGCRGDGLSTTNFNGYLSSVRVIKGSAEYTGSTYTVPTSPLTAITNTSLLLNYTNGAIFDNAAVADYETVGNAQISTSVKKYGTGSMAFDGTGDYLVAPSRAVTSLSGDFTIEFWAYRNSGAFRGFTIGDDSLSSGLSVYYSTGSSAWVVYNANTSRISGGVFSTSVWYHIAVVRVAGIVKLYVNGTQAGSTWSSTGTFNGAVYVSAEYNAGTAYSDTNGYIDDFRITNGVGRYPYNFTPPTAEFPNIGGTVTLTADPYFDYTTLLLPGNGTNGAQNNTFLDSSTNAFSITRNGNTTQGTFSPFSQTGWGNYFDGTGDYLDFPSSSAFTMGTGDFTIELWYYPSVNYVSGNGYLFDLGSNGTRVQLFNNQIYFLPVAGSGVTGSAGVGVLAGTWYHIACVRSGSTITVYLNGTSIGSVSNSSNLTDNDCRIGEWGGGTAGPFNGYMSNLRIVKGTAVYTSNFTPSTTPLTSITNTSLLTCQSNRFIDNSTNAFAITRNGDVSVQAFSPFNPTAAWSAATYGGSGYFDGSGDYLTVADNAALQMGSGDFTIEYWWYPNNITSYQNPIDKGYSGSGAFLLQTGNGDGRILVIASGSIVITSSTAVTVNAWNHMAVVRSGTTLTLYQNGVSVGSATNSTNFNSTAPLGIGATATAPGGGSVGAFPIVGFLSGVRFVKGTAVYSGSTYTVPTAPLTAITNTSLLLNYTNAGIYDATSKNDLETVGNAQISTAQSKFGGSSMYFDGTDDGLRFYEILNTQFGTGDFTVEAWVYITSFSVPQVVVDARGSTTAAAPWQFYVNASNKVVFNYGSNLIGTISVAASTWTHIAATRYGSTLRIFVNGILDSSATTSASLNGVGGQPVYVGRVYDSPGSPYFSGYIDDLRITKGIARYTSNFIPPTTAFLTL